MLLPPSLLSDRFIQIIVFPDDGPMGSETCRN